MSIMLKSFTLNANHTFDRAVSFEIHLGTHILNGEDPNRVILSTSTYYCHPDYDPNTLNNDIGLIKFRIPVQLTGRFICVSRNFEITLF